MSQYLDASSIKFPYLVAIVTQIGRKIEFKRLRRIAWVLPCPGPRARQVDEAGNLPSLSEGAHRQTNTAQTRIHKHIHTDTDTDTDTHADTTDTDP